MARYIVKDDNYGKEPMVFGSYKEMIDKIQAICKAKGKKFTEKDEKELKYKVERVLDA